ncbi:phosphotransferase family protein [Dactylosporangium sp. NPDC048998]|uniref:phosphotransferase family protein n=1 Tax=Dactylosporangium sp. NPDC048998 TaxID=3363976 RepID=UPI0037191916
MVKRSDAQPVSEAEELEGLLDKRLTHLHGESRTVEKLRRVSGGASRQTWAFRTLDAERRPMDLVLRRDPPSEPRPEEMAREASALQAARRHGVPGPDLLDWSADPGDLGAPYLIMTFVPGDTIARRILRDERYRHARSVLARDLGRAAARIHQVPPAEVPDIPVADVLQDLRRRYASVGIGRPVLEMGFRWLEDHRPPANFDTVLVHGDFRLGNVIVDANGLAAVLDWELVHLGDPMEDLGYLRIRAWRFGGTKPVAGVGEYNDLFDAYAEVSGSRPDAEAVYWWQVAGTLSWGVGCLVQAQRHFAGASRSVELAAIGRRVAEQEYDILQMLRGSPRPGRRADAAHLPGRLRDRHSSAGVPRARRRPLEHCHSTRESRRTCSASSNAS